MLDGPATQVHVVAREYLVHLDYEDETDSPENLDVLERKET